MTTELRTQALDLSVKAGGPHDDVVARAEAYLTFLLGGTADVATPGTKTTPAKDKKPNAATEAALDAAEKGETTKVDSPEQLIEELNKDDEAPAVEYADVKRCILGISSKLGRDVATKLLGEFGVEKGPDLKPTDYAAFVAKAEPMLEGK